MDTFTGIYTVIMDFSVIVHSFVLVTHRHYQSYIVLLATWGGGRSFPFHKFHLLQGEFQREYRFVLWLTLQYLSQQQACALNKFD
jgi:hypothetical protein